MLKDKYSIDEVSMMSGLTTRTIRNYLKDAHVRVILTGVEAEVRKIYLQI